MENTLLVEHIVLVGYKGITGEEPVLSSLSPAAVSGMNPVIPPRAGKLDPYACTHTLRADI